MESRDHGESPTTSATVTMCTFPKGRQAWGEYAHATRSDHDCVAAPHVRLGLSESFHDLGDDTVQQQDRRVFK